MKTCVIFHHSGSIRSRRANQRIYVGSRVGRKIFILLVMLHGIRDIRAFHPFCIKNGVAGEQIRENNGCRQTAVQIPPVERVARFGGA